MCHIIVTLRQLLCLIRYFASNVTFKSSSYAFRSLLILYSLCSTGFIPGGEKSTNATQIYKTLLLAKMKSGIKSENDEEQSVILRGVEGVQITEINILIVAAAVLCLCRDMGSDIMPL